MRLSSKEWRCMCSTLYELDGVSNQAEALIERVNPEMEDHGQGFYVMTLDQIEQLIRKAVGHSQVSVDYMGGEFSLNVNGVLSNLRDDVK